MRIFISTNSDKPKNLYTSDEDKRRVRTFMSSNGFGQNATDIIKELCTNVFLISDSYPVLPEKITIDRQSDYLLYHQLTKEGVQNAFDNKTFGNHLIGEEYKYGKVFEILLNNRPADKKAEEIVKSIFYDPQEETLTEDVFNVIYRQQDEEAIEKAVNKRDKYIIGKGKN